jgi:ATP/maltotriose-dependent transcriptional regulator MalT
VVDESAGVPIVRPQPELVGRDAERAEVDGFLARARSGARALVIHGDAGIGKTALWRFGVAAARDEGWLVLSTRPAEEEMPLALAGLVDLFEEHDLAVDALAPDTGQLARGRAVLDALRSLAANTPVLLAIDDLQWLDITSARTLRYALRRLDEEPVGVLATARTGSDTESPLGLRSTLPPGRSDRLELGPLSLGALRRVVAGIVDAITRPTLRRIQEVSGGNPLYAIELARALAADRESPSMGVRLPDSLQSAIDQRLDAAPAELLPLLETMSGLGSAPLGTIETAMPGAEVPALVALAQQWQLLVVEENLVVRFAHPLLASAVYGRMGTLERRSLHAELARAASDAEARVRHIALSTDEPDAEIAALLEEASSRASARGAPELAAELVRHSLRLTPPGDQEDSLRRALAEIESRWAAGEAGRAGTLVEELVDSLPPGPARAEAIIVGADVADIAEREGPLLLEALEESAEDPRLQCRVLTLLADSRADAGDLPAGVEFGRRGLALAEEVGDPQLELVAATLLGHLEAQVGQPRPDLMDRAVSLEDEMGMPIFTQGPRELLVKHRLWAGDLPGARTLLEQTRAAAARSGLASKEMQYLYDLALVECAAGNLDEADRDVTRAVEAALDADDMWSERLLLYARSLIDAWLGRADEARRAAKRLVDETGSLGMNKAVPRGLSVLGLLALSEGDAEGAARDLAEAARRREEMGIRHPGAEPELADAVEALALAGELDAATDLMERLQRQADEVGSPWPLAAATRARGALLLAKGEAAEAATMLHDTAATFDRLGFRPDAARARLLEGRAILRDGRRSQAAEVLATARDEFAAIGASLWETRAVEELERVSPGRGSGDLTPTEGRIAALVAEGLKNREIAERLFLSVATVEAHLTRIYRKLGIRSRSDLTRLVVDDELSFPAGS